MPAHARARPGRGRWQWALGPVARLSPQARSAPPEPIAARGATHWFPTRLKAIPFLRCALPHSWGGDAEGACRRAVRAIHRGQGGLDGGQARGRAGGECLRVGIQGALLTSFPPGRLPSQRMCPHFSLARLAYSMSCPTLHLLISSRMAAFSRAVCGGAACGLDDGVPRKHLVPSIADGARERATRSFARPDSRVPSLHWWSALLSVLPVLRIVQFDERRPNDPSRRRGLGPNCQQCLAIECASLKPSGSADVASFAVLSPPPPPLRLLQSTGSLLRLWHLQSGGSASDGSVQREWPHCRLCAHIY